MNYKPNYFLQHGCPVDPGAILELTGWRSLRGTKDSYCSIFHSKIFGQDQENKISGGKTIQSMSNKCLSLHDFFTNNSNKGLSTQENSTSLCIWGKQTLFEDPATIQSALSHFLTSASLYSNPSEATLHLEHCSTFFSQGHCRFYHLCHTQGLLSLQNVAGGFKAICPDFTGSLVLPFSFPCPWGWELTGKAIFCKHKQWK